MEERIDSGILLGPKEDIEKKETAKDHAKPNIFREEHSQRSVTGIYRYRELIRR